MEKGGGWVRDGDNASHILTAVARPLSGRLPTIAAGLAEQILAEDGAYAALVAPAELRDTILHNLGQAMTSMLDRSEDRPVDLSDAVLSLGLALLGVTALTHRRWLYWVAVAFASFGLIVSGAGLLNLNLHLATLTGWLGA